jgi:hypothetical protein
MRFFVKHPPAGDDILDKPNNEWKACTSALTAEYDRVATKIEMCEAAFEETGNPIFAIQAYLLATNAKLNPPLWVQGFVQACFNRVAAGGVSLDRAFGFSREGVGKGRWTTPEQAITLARRNREICMAVYKYEALGMSRNAACDVAASVMVDGDGVEVLSASAIRAVLIDNDRDDKYKTERKVIQAAATTWTDDEKRQVVSNINPATLPKKIRQQLNL